MYHTFWLVICKLMRIRIQFITLMRIGMRILPFNLMQIHADPQHWYHEIKKNSYGMVKSIKCAEKLINSAFHDWRIVESSFL